MKIRNFIALLLLCFTANGVTAQNKKFKVHTIAFYNLENLFDTIKGPNNDEEWLPKGAQSWTRQKYQKKLDNLSRVLPEIGTGENPNAPVIIGCAEVENRGVLEDLVKQPRMLEKGYGVIHFDSPDKRGIDVGFLYQKKHFQPTSYKNIPLYIYENEEGLNKKTKSDGDDKADDNVNVDAKTKRVYTRDQLLVTGLLDGEEISVIVNHWPSRSGGEKKSSPFREAAGALNKKIIDSLYKINPNAKVITMGDLNDGPYNKSIKVALGAKGKKEDVKEFGMFNPMEQMSKDGLGTLAYRDAWDIFDQIIVSEPLIRKDYSSLRFWKAGIFNKPYLIQKTGQYQGYPLRNSNGEPGFSDHFPVYIYLIKEVK
ncbi:MULTISPECIES: endonuclease/exonuclease/phosphatase family protein [Flavobacterium]|uniref:endonuclease/exonuclease/phosphatase family protein n=1 Tax=Flavobacterium TaxID=237 RepID=UPI000960E992|nr:MULTISPECIES: endonuclease/exonuclease/phosphatase family protein [Flavobacterium]MBN9284601.1 endonuclease/exonuclease/phosphatase family protein [Flavobacterium sp.]OJV72649.1 MAG: endonuclease [Flavobacterium sp. 40-81]